jgi:cytochrome c oxidase cbb3-type subunit 4
MTHHAVTVFTQIAALILFIALFAAVLLYVFWPGTKKKFDEAAKLPLEDEEDDKPEDGDRS